jgi:hypothetical protein
MKNQKEGHSRVSSYAGGNGAGILLHPNIMHQIKSPELPANSSEEDEEPPVIRARPSDEALTHS